MNKNYLLVLLAFSISFNISASLRPIAEEVQRMHNLNSAFYKHDLFINATPIGEKLKTELREGTQAEIQPGKLSSLVSQGAQSISITIPFEGNIITIDLIRTNIFTEDFMVLTGENKIQPYSPGTYYHGIISGNPNSLAAFSFFNDQLYGTISDNTHGNIVIGKLLNQGNKTDYVIYSDKNLIRPFPDFCNTTNQDPASLTAEKLTRQSSGTTTAKCARIYYEVDHDQYINNNSDVVTTTNWITALHNNIQTLYANDNISVALSQVYVWTTNDPFNGANSQDQLQTFKNTRLSFNGDLAILIAQDNGYGGLGYVDALCTNSHYCYADVDFNYNTVPAYSWTIEASTHEIGHVLGSRHTQNCGWPIGALDDCYATEGGCPPGPTPVNGGTIMSYCHLSGTGINFVNGFGPYPRDTIIYAVNHASCLGASCAVCPVPAHDACTTPATLVVSANCVYVPGNLCGSTESIPPISCGGFTAAHGYDVWYKVVPGQTTMNINCNSGTATDVVLAVYSGTCGSLSLLNCVDATGTGGVESIAATVTAGSTYYIRVYDHNSNASGTDFAICASQNCMGSTNNSCASATALTIGSNCSYSNGDLCAATQSSGPVSCSGSTAQTALDLWYSITPTQNTVQITGSSGANTDLILGLYDGACGSLNLIRCMDTTGFGGTEQFTVSLTPGTTYYIRVYDWNGNQYGTDYRICARYICTTPFAPTSVNAAPAAICAGSSTTLNVTGTLSPFATWHWYSGTCGGTAVGTGTSVSITPSATTTYYVRAENGTCISTCKFVTVTVIPFPAAPVSASANPNAVCPGNTSALSVTGSLSVGAAWYWYKDSCGGTSAGTGATVNITPAAGATYFVRAQNGSCYSSCSSAIVTMNAPPSDPVSLTANIDSICPGDSVTLNVSGTLSGGASWHWYTGSCGTIQAGIGTTITKAPITATTYYVRAENGNCFSNCITKTINIHSSPGTASSAGPSSSICPGDSATIIVTGTLGSGSNWYWYADSCGGTVLAQGASLPLAPTVSRTYYVRAENSACKSSCQNATVNVTTPPASPIINVAGNILSVPAAIVYQWYFSATGVTYNATETTQQIFAVNDGYYYVVISDANGCSANSDTVLYIDPNGINENSSSDIVRVYPNPFHNTFTVIINDSRNSEFALKLFDSTGRLIVNETRHSNINSSVSLESYANGIYELVIYAGEKIITVPVVKE